MKTIKFMMMMFVSTSLSLSFTACSDSDDEPGTGSESETTTGLSVIPPSIVDGMCVAGIDANDGTSAISFDYNADGSVKSAVVHGVEYDFEYAESRSEKKLVRISAKREGESYVAENFVEGVNGFVLSFTEKISFNYDDTNEWGTAESNVKLTYNAENRVTSMKQTGQEDYYCFDEEYGTQHETGNYDFTIKYNYSSGVLKSTVGTYNDMFGDSEKAIADYSYDAVDGVQPHTNTYNLYTPQLAVGVAQYDPIAYVLCIRGYMGNASSVLPTGFTETHEEFTDGESDYYDSENYIIKYTFDSINRVKSVNMFNDYGTQYVYNISYYQVKYQ